MKKRIQMQKRDSWDKKFFPVAESLARAWDEGDTDEYERIKRVLENMGCTVKSRDDGEPGFTIVEPPIVELFERKRKK